MTWKSQNNPHSIPPFGEKFYRHGRDKARSNKGDLNNPQLQCSNLPTRLAGCLGGTAAPSRLCDGRYAGTLWIAGFPPCNRNNSLAPVFGASGSARRAWLASYGVSVRCSFRNTPHRAETFVPRACPDWAFPPIRAGNTAQRGNWRPVHSSLRTGRLSSPQGDEARGEARQFQITMPSMLAQTSASTTGTESIPAKVNSSVRGCEALVIVAFMRRGLRCVHNSAIPPLWRGKSTDISSRGRTELSEPLWGRCARPYGRSTRTPVLRRSATATRVMRAATCPVKYRFPPSCLQPSTSNWSDASNKEAA